MSTHNIIMLYAKSPENRGFFFRCFQGHSLYTLLLDMNSKVPVHTSTMSWQIMVFAVYTLALSLSMQGINFSR